MNWVIALRGATILSSVVAAAGAFAAETAPPPPGASYDCLMEPRLQLKIATPVAGVVGQVMADRGTIVHRGDTLAQLESGVEAAEMRLAAAKAVSTAQIDSRTSRLAFLSRKRNRQASLQINKVVSDATLDEADTDMKVAEQDLRDAQAQREIAKVDLERATEVLTRRTIKSPIDGVVTDRSLGPGEYAYEQAPILQLAQLDPLNVEVFMPVATFGVVRPGMRAEIRPEAPVGGVYAGTVDVVDRVFDSRSGTYGVRLILPNPGNALPAGLRCRLSFPQQAVSSQ